MDFLQFFVNLYDVVESVCQNVRLGMAPAHQHAPQTIIGSTYIVFTLTLDHLPPLLRILGIEGDALPPTSTSNGAVNVAQSFARAIVLDIIVAVTRPRLLTAGSATNGVATSIVIVATIATGTACDITTCDITTCDITLDTFIAYVADIASST